MRPADLFRPAPGSILAQRMGDGQGRASVKMPLLMLVWSVWLFATPLYEPAVFRDWMWPTLCSYAVFLLLYHRAYYGERRQLRWIVPGMAMLALVLLPFNPGSQCYLIYACAFAAFLGQPAQALRAMAVMLTLFVAVWFAVGWSPLYIVSAVMVGLAVGLMNLSFERRARADAALRLSHDEVRRLAAVAERERIGRDLHDLLGHTLSLVALKADLAARLVERDPQRARSEIDAVAKVSREALAQVRHAVTGIRAAGLAAELAAGHLLLDIDGIVFDYRLAELALPVDQETVLALTVREALTNIQRHAGAARASVTLQRVQDHVLLRIEDDGCGRAIVAGNGLTGMRERLQALGGGLHVDSRRGRGCVIEARLPLPGTRGDTPTPAPASLRTTVQPT